MTEDIVIHENLRVQVLSETLVRIEERGASGFEDRPSFNVVERAWPGVAVTRRDTDSGVQLDSAQWRATVMGPRPGVESVRFHAPDGAVLFDGARPLAARVFLPAPSDSITGWAFDDRPRLIPPAWGALPPPDDSHPASGWATETAARDVYVFLPGPGGYRRLVEDFLRLCGRVPLPPFRALGLIDSRYYAYTQQEALSVIDEYRARNIPLDIFVLDTDWRVGASHGYGVNTALLPDLPAFVREAHARNVRVMLNDHPEPAHPVALSPAELRYRHEGLTSLLNMGVDYWWFDRNWHVSLAEPAPGVSRDVWGMSLYHDVAQAHHPDQRVLVMSNVEGIDNGALTAPSSPASHRFPIWWTGDTRAAWKDLRRGVQNAVNSGVRSLLPYISEDLGGHFDTPDEELYARFVQYGALSPICRLHCSANLHRHPWRFGAAGEIAAEYIRLRYRLLPTFYAAAREAHDSGRPLLRRCDVYWPGEPESRDDTQYLLGPDLLVAPILESVVPLSVLPSEFLVAANGQSGLDAEYFANTRFEGEPAARVVEHEISHAWAGQPPLPHLDGRKFSTRWTGTFGPAPESGLYRIAIRTDDRVRVWLDADLILDRGESPGAVYIFADVMLQKDRRYALRIEYASTGSWNTMCELLWGRHRRAVADRAVWIPPGRWHAVWNGASFTGPATICVPASLAQVPLFVRGGGFVFSAPSRESTGQPVWPDVCVDLFAPQGDSASMRELYEDDGDSLGYLSGQSRRTRFISERRGDVWRLTIEPSRGAFAADGERAVRLRWHGLSRQPAEVRVNEEQQVGFRWGQTQVRLPLGALAERGAAAISPVLELDLPARPVNEPCLVELRGLAKDTT
ncbi:MAG TPA: glycoside hydrolase family 31 protein [Kiritimatiellia bacterium]|nr:glycoside hydrolase family 31 protein [Kiritimatiellia bacterium]